MPRDRRQFFRHGTLPQMAVFEAIVRLGSFTRAAQEMHMAQPTVSGLVRRLSDTVGAQLFQKIGRRMAPTAAGSRVCAAAAEIFCALERMGTDLAALRDAQIAARSCADRVLTSRVPISLGVSPSAEAPKNGITNRRVRAPRWAPMLHAADCPLALLRVSTASSEGTQKSQTGIPHPMDDTIDYSIVFAKTPKGVSEINARSGALSLQARRVLIMIDGRRAVAELMAVVRTGEFDGIISTLETQGMIEKVDLSSLPPRDFEQEDFADTISLLQENAAALRGIPQVNPATLVPQPVTPRAPATITAAHNIEPAVDAAAIAARAVATASAPRPIEPAVRRPPTISMPHPATINDMAAGTARPGTLNGTMRAPDPARRPPTLSGARPVPMNEPSAVAVEAPVRPAPATIRVEMPPAPSAPVASAAPATSAAPAAGPASTASAPAAAPTAPAASTAPAANAAAAAATAPPPRTLEEEKRLAVSELYSVLGPYGEQPVAKLQECMTMDALREQIKQAGKRVATFRGEKAAQDYLRAVGHA